MAITVSLLGTPTFNTTSGTKTVTATPVVGDLIIIITAHSGNTSTAAPTDNNAGGGGTYTLINSAVKATSADTMRVWVRNNLITSATSTVFTHAPGTTTGGGLVVIDCQGGDKAGSSAIVQSAIQSNQAAGTPAPVFGAAVNAQNAVIGAVFNASNPAALTPRTNFTELYDSGYNTPTTGLEVMSDNSGETGTTMTWGSASASAYCSIVVELESSVTHATTGTLTGQIGSVSGTAQHNIPHPTSGTLTGQGSSITGSATSFSKFSTSGALTGQGSSVVGSADREAAVIPHVTDGTLVGQGSTVSGSATRYRQFATSGVLTGQGSVITGDADREALVIPHVTDGTLVGQGATATGSATRYRQFASSGALTGQSSVITGDANNAYVFTTSGALVGQGSIVTGDADHVSLTHDTSGDLVAGTATVTGKAVNGIEEQETNGAFTRRQVRPRLIVVSVDGKDYRVPETQLPAFLDALQQKIELTPVVKKKRKKKAKAKAEVVELQELPQIVIKSAPVSIIPQVQNAVDEINTIIAKSFSKALQNYIQTHEDVQIQVSRKLKREQDEAIILMLM